MAQRQSQTLTVTQRYGLALMRVWIAQNRLAERWYVNRRDEEAEFQEALVEYRAIAEQTPWWGIASIHRGLQVGITPEGRVLPGVTQD